MPEPTDETIATYREQAIKLLPPGRLATHVGSQVARVLEGLVVELARLHTEAALLLANRAPLKAIDYLADWEAAAGLPDTSCGQVAPVDTGARQLAIAGRLTEYADRSLAALTALATTRGLVIASVRHYAPFTAGIRAGQPVYGPAYAYTTRIRVTTAGGAVAAADAVEAFECLVNARIKRAHTHVSVYSALADEDAVGTFGVRFYYYLDLDTPANRAAAIAAVSSFEGVSYDSPKTRADIEHVLESIDLPDGTSGDSAYLDAIRPPTIPAGQAIHVLEASHSDDFAYVNSAITYSLAPDSEDARNAFVGAIFPEVIAHLIPGEALTDAALQAAAPPGVTLTIVSIVPAGGAPNEWVSSFSAFYDE